MHIEQSRPTVMLLDLNNLLWRAAGATAMTNLTNSKGKVTGHVYNLIKMFISYWDRADLIVLAEDRRCHRRYSIYPEYKGNRKEKNEEQEAVFNMVKELRDVVDLFPCPHAYAEAEEADDVMATLALKFSSKGYDVIIVSSDKDLWQVIQTNIKVMTGSDRVVKGDMFEDKFNITDDMVQTHFVLTKSLLGDKSDNITPVGSRMMSKDLKRLLSLCDGSIDGLLNVCKTDHSGTAKKIIAGEEILRRNYALCKLRTDLDVVFTVNNGDLDKLRSVVEESECVSLFGDLGKFNYPPKNYDDMKEVSIYE